MVRSGNTSRKEIEAAGEAAAMTSTREVCAKIRGPTLIVSPFCCSFRTSSNDSGRNTSMGAPCYNLHSHAIFFLEHGHNILEGAFQTMGRCNRQDFSVNSGVGSHQACEAGYEGHRCAKFPNSHHGSISLIFCQSDPDCPCIARHNPLSALLPLVLNSTTLVTSKVRVMERLYPQDRYQSKY